MSIEETVARDQIRALMAEYNQAGDAGDAERVVRTFAPEAELETISGTISGLAAIRSFFDERARVRREDARLDRSARHFLSTQLITVDGDSADGSTYFLFVRTGRIEHVGTYLDHFVRLEGRWLIRRRSVVMNWLDEGTL
ncbi:nuclear transport factor 2 family protein [Microbacterium aurantiacum]|uniref:Nuclear transport factor 2 family protein n=1 Tax=Microbacterium aurantiacum TaxID=162393 RepID=A0ABT8FVQ1_9MICO|nr:nuclear transport factor 2 family protein [Microbacterium aurantiacum]MDN4465389.1 nuclear transport factor 2 family protein [Microbacterium aurantiacum]